ncbi:MAG TPA: cytochrome b561 domain-containing protein [Noviherbaspirillum sp.]|uniref:cytochrome b561 domain-containing protein n=1 Tax=Noviherbaspirillum sp. TaxID=1926288 RepID=UPI002B49BB36|nr:cytochrome b561 domain-containing protein [Noviherbaspirillum sp.]HJV88204.1 cytochrome b561 domain-containing protein [Noviherbaspirillum sp.]
MNTQIPTEVYLAFLGRTIDIHWDRHAFLMITAWFVLVPAGVIAIRFFKPLPKPDGIARGTGRFDRNLLWWTIHWTFLYTAIALSLAGMTVALVVSKGFSGSLHAVFGIGTVVFGCMQIVSAWFRGTHGGKHGAHSDPSDPSTWHGDHYDMTPRRRWFEAYHKNGGYFTLALAIAAASTGVQQLWIDAVAVFILVILGVLLMIAVVLEGWGYRQDTYRSVYGNHPDHPFNKARKHL